MITKIKEIVLLLYIFSLIGCATPIDYGTIDGPEATNLITQMSGYILMDRPVGNIDAIQIPSLDRKPLCSSTNAIHDLSGPDSKGHVLIIEVLGNSFALKQISINNSDEKLIFKREGDPIWDKVIGRIALSTSNDLAAFVSGMKSIYMRVEPNTYYKEGLMEIWDIKKKELVPSKRMTVLDESISWLPDGKKLAFAALVSPREIGESFYKANNEILHQGWVVPLADGRVPVVFTYDIESQKTIAIHIGRNPIVRSDGLALLFQGIKGESILYEFSTEKAQMVKCPGLYQDSHQSVQRVIALLENNLILYWGIRTEGSKLELTKNNSPFVGAKQMLTLKVARLNTMEFQTVVPFVDPRREVSFGRIQQQE